jgi:hypothetical protein
MLFENDHLEDIDWYIETKPKPDNIKFRTSKKNLKPSDMDKVVLDFTSTNIKLNFPLNDNYSVFKIRSISGHQTLQSLLENIYDFYQSKIPDELVDEIFFDFPELYQELTNDLESGDKLSYIDAFSGSTCEPDFVGLTQDDSDSKLFTVQLGPL